MRDRNRPRHAKGEVDLSAVQSLGEFAGVCKALCEGRSYADLARAARPRSLPASTLSNLLNAKSTPTRETLTTFLIACGVVDESTQRSWLSVWDRVANNHLSSPAGAVRVHEARPRHLGVHAAIQVSGAVDELPPYVARDLDADLRSTIADAAASGGLIVLVGTSSVGKTRALIEALRAELPQWWLIHPVDTAAVTQHAEAPTSRTVLWLDELQLHLNRGKGVVAPSVQRLIAAKTLVVATLWPDEYTMRTLRPEAGVPDPYADDRVLLRLAQVVRVPDSFSTAERQRGEALAADDERLRIALSASDAGVTQVLAGGPELVHRWEQAPEQHCYGKAVITAALDAARVGAHHFVTAEYLRAAAPAYLTPAQRANASAEDWLDLALEYATARVHGATACLNPISAEMGEVAGYVTADYLYQHALQVRRSVRLPTPAWNALVAHHHPHDRIRLALNAERRAADEAAIALYRQVIEHADEDDHESATYQLVRLLGRQGQVEELRVLSDGGSALAVDQLAHVFVRQGRVDDAVTILGQYLDGCYGVYSPADLVVEGHLGRLLADLGRVDELRARASVGYTLAASSLFELLAANGDFEELRQRAKTEKVAELWLDSLLRRFGHIEELRVRAAAGDQYALSQLVEYLVENDRFDEARSALRTHGGPGAELIGRNVEAVQLAEEGNVKELELRAAAGDDMAATVAACLAVTRLLEVQDVAAAVRLAQDRARQGDDLVTERLVDLLIAHDHLDQVRSLADGGSRHAADQLTDFLASQERITELQDEVAAGTLRAVERLHALTALPRE